MRLHPLLPVLAVLTALALTGCTNPGGPLLVGNTDATQCADSATHTDTVFGVYIKNAAPHPVTITDVAFGPSTNVTLAGAWVVANYRDGDTMEGVGVQDYPLDTPAWTAREAIPGASVTGNTETNLALRLTLTPTMSTGEVQGITVSYKDDDGQSFSATTNAKFEFGTCR